MLEPFKFIVQAVLVQRDDEDKIAAEHSADPVALYGVNALREWADGFDEQLAELNKREETS